MTRFRHMMRLHAKQHVLWKREGYRREAELALHFAKLYRDMAETLREIALHPPG